MNVFEQAKRELQQSIIVRGLLVALLLVGGGFWGVRIYQWRAYVNERTYTNDQAYQFLANGFKGPDGRIYNRSQVLDAIVQQTLKNLVQAQQQAAAKSQAAAPLPAGKGKP